MKLRYSPAIVAMAAADLAPAPGEASGSRHGYRARSRMLHMIPPDLIPMEQLAPFFNANRRRNIIFQPALRLERQASERVCAEARERSVLYVPRLPLFPRGAQSSAGLSKDDDICAFQVLPVIFPPHRPGKIKIVFGAQIIFRFFSIHTFPLMDSSRSGADYADFICAFSVGN